jgi:protein subunit release factor B
MNDCDLQTFRAGGKGGQNQNKRDTGVRIIHRASGAVGESREHRSQLENKRAAFKRMAESQKFKTWLNRELYGRLEAERKTEQDMQPQNLKVEGLKNGRWRELEEDFVECYSCKGPPDHSEAACQGDYEGNWA